MNIKNAAAVELGKEGGLRTSPAKKRAAKQNGAKGGRPLSIMCRLCDGSFSVSKNETGVYVSNHRCV